MKNLFLVTFLFCFAGNSREIKEWSYDKLKKEAIAIVIASPIESKSENLMIPLEGLFAYGKQVKAPAVITKFNVKSYLKGEGSKTIQVRHIKFPDKANSKTYPEFFVHSAPSIISFDKKTDKDFLLFLVKDKSKFILVGGFINMNLSVKELN